MKRVVFVLTCFFIQVSPAQQTDSLFLYEAEAENGELYADDEYQDESLFDAEPREMKPTRRYRSEKLELRKFDETKWKALVGDADFNEDPPEEPEREEEESGGFSIPWGGPLLKLISYVVVIGVVIWLLYAVVRNVSWDLKIKRAELRTEDIEKGVENIEDVDIQKLLEQARREANFRVAVRLHYLGLLKKLHELNAIVWKKDKTNRDYLAELFVKDFCFDEIRKLTNSYEAVWYGEHVLQPETFQRLSARFEEVYQRINNSEAK